MKEVERIRLEVENSCKLIQQLNWIEKGGLIMGRDVDSVKVLEEIKSVRKSALNNKKIDGNGHYQRDDQNVEVEFHQDQCRQEQ